MTDDERERIRQEAKDDADTKNRLAALERSVSNLERDRGNVLRAVFFTLIGGFMGLVAMAWDNIKEFIFK